MPETEAFTADESELADERLVVREFYSAKGLADTAKLGAIIDARFHPTVSISSPESLPQGGTVTGVAAVREALTTADAGRGGASNVRLVSLAGDGPILAAVVEFDWRSDAEAPVVATSAVEVWDFADGLVTNIRTFNWDTQALMTESSERPHPH